MSIKRVLAAATIKISKVDNYLAEPQVDAEILLAAVLQKNRSYLHTWPEASLSVLQNQQFNSYIARRERGEPVAYILGKKAFWDLELTITKDVLIPRPETEILVEYILQNFAISKKVKLLDLGTGSGAIALAIAKHRPSWQIVALDVCAKALAVAKNNAKQLKIINIEFILSSWMDNLKERERFDIIVGNPPYVAENNSYLMKGDVRFEPKQALIAVCNGLDALKKIIISAKKNLNNNGCIILEHGFDQNTAVTSLLLKNNFNDIVAIKDFSGHCRAIVGISR